MPTKVPSKPHPTVAALDAYLVKEACFDKRRLFGYHNPHLAEQENYKAVEGLSCLEEETPGKAFASPYKRTTGVQVDEEVFPLVVFKALLRPHLRKQEEALAKDPSTALEGFLGLFPKPTVGPKERQEALQALTEVLEGLELLSPLGFTAVTYPGLAQDEVEGVFATYPVASLFRALEAHKYNLQNKA